MLVKWFCDNHCRTQPQNSREYLVSVLVTGAHEMVDCWPLPRVLTSWQRRNISLVSWSLLYKASLDVLENVSKKRQLTQRLDISR